VTSVDDLRATADDGPTGPEPSTTPRRRSPFTLLLTVAPFAGVLTTIALLAQRASRPLGNADTYFHLRFGREFLDGDWSLRHPGSVTTFGTNDWTPTQWLPQVVMAQLEEWFGLPGVAWLAGFLHIGLFVALWFIARRYASPLVAAIVVALAMLTISPGLSMRPQVLSYLLVAVTAAAWLATREDRRVRWWLVPLTWVWAMVHGMWPVGIIIGFVALAGIAFDRAASRREWFRLLLVPVLSSVAAALTPVGPQLYSAVLLVNSRAKYFAEWQPPRFTSGYCVAFLLLAGLLLVRILRRRGPTSWTEVLLLLLAGGWALYTARTVMVAAMILVPMTARALQELGRERRTVGRPERAVVLGGAVLALVGLAVVVPRTADRPPPDPEWFADVAALPPGTVVLNDWGEGGYYMWRFPDLDLVMNGYGDVFTDDELADNFRMDSTNPGWLRTVKATGATYALLKPRSNLATELRDIADWRVVHESQDVELLVPPDGWPAGAPG
jgi:hypothetical protein